MKRAAVELIVTLVVIGLYTWAEMPEHEQRRIVLDLNLRYRKVLSRCARAMARRAMSWELDGDPQAADALYDAAYRLMSGPYHRAEDAYRRTLGVQR